MRIIYKTILSIAVALPVVTTGASAVVSANEDGADNATASNSVNSDSNSEVEKTKRAERLEKHKAELKIKLSNIDKNRIKDRCKQAQGGGIKRLDGRIKGIETSRDKVHTNLVNRLNKLVEKLKTKAVDTAALESEIAVLITKIETFKADLATYKQNLTDLKAMDCASDPTAFKAQLEVVRTDREKVHQDVIDIRKYVKETIKSTLKEIRSQLEEQEQTDSDSDNQANNTAGGGE